jgi:hypothetical protein
MNMHEYSTIIAERENPHIKVARNIHFCIHYLKKNTFPSEIHSLVGIVPGGAGNLSCGRI